MYASVFSPTCCTALRLRMWAMEKLFLWSDGEFLGRANILSSIVRCTVSASVFAIFRQALLLQTQMNSFCFLWGWLSLQGMEMLAQSKVECLMLREFYWSLWTPQNIPYAWITSNLWTLDVEVYWCASSVSSTQLNLAWFVRRTAHWWKNLYTVVICCVVVMNNRPLKNE